MAKRAKPEEIIAKLREAEVRLSQGESVGKAAKALIEGWRIHYNTYRPHSSLG